MPEYSHRFARLFSMLNRLADGFLCFSGMVLAYWGLFSIDNAGVRYPIIMAGCLFFCSGCWFFKRGIKQGKE